MNRSDHFEIRDYCDEDIPALAGLMGELGYPTSESEMQTRMDELNATGSNMTLIAECNGLVAGVLGMSKSLYWEQNGFYFKIQALVVSADFRRMGIGKALMEKAESRAKKLGARHISLTSSISDERKSAHLFYPSLGYERRSYGYRKIL